LPFSQGFASLALGYILSLLRGLSLIVEAFVQCWTQNNTTETVTDLLLPVRSGPH